MNQSAVRSLCLLALFSCAAPAFGSDISLAAIKARSQQDLEQNVRETLVVARKALRQDAVSATTPAVLRAQLERSLSDNTAVAEALTTTRVKLARAD